MGEGCIEIESVAVGLLQLPQALVKALDELGLRLVAGMVGHLERIPPDIVQARLGDFRVKDELPVADRHRALQAEVCAVNRLDL